MEKQIPGYISGFGSVKEMYDLIHFEDDNAFTDAGMTELRKKDSLSTAECDKLCENLSGEVNTFRIKNLNT